jgi:23S rRNA (cytosine1962-C5)-methyltransferase
MNWVQLRKGKEKAAKQLHPWVFSGAIEQPKAGISNGEIVRLVDFRGDFLAYGFYNSISRVAVRLLEWNERNVVDDEWWRNRVNSALESRHGLFISEHTNTFRLIFAEADYLPGLIVDKYANFLSVQIHSAGIEKVKNLLLDELENRLSPTGIFERSDASAREHEGLSPATGRLRGEAPPELVEVIENGIKYRVNISEGQKSGFFCDQRHNRKVVAEHAKNKRVLDCFSYSGGFTLNALYAGAAEVISVDSSALAIETLKENLALNNFNSPKTIAYQTDVSKQLRTLKENKEEFDIIVLDPPKYAPSYSKLDRAARAYKDLNRMGMLLLKKGGLLATFSCSGAVDMGTFKQILAWAALDAGKEIQFIYQFCQPEDHPVRASFPEGEYLKGLLCRIS